MIKYSSFIIFYIIVIQNLVAETDLNGTVFHFHNKDPIDNVNVYIDSSSRGTSTDSNGKFTLQIFREDSVLVFEHVGFNKITKKIDQNKSDFSIYLMPKIISFSELDVLGQNETGAFNDFETKNMINDISVKDISFRIYEDIGDILMNEESVLIDETNRGSKTVSIRGARQEEMVFMYDGVPLHNDGRKSLDLSMFNIGGLEAIEVVKGSHEKAFGSSGTINFVPTIIYGNSISLFQRFGTYNTGSYSGAVSVGNQYMSFNVGENKAESRQFYENADNADIFRQSSNTYLNSGFKVFSNMELKLSHLNNESAYTDFYQSDSVASTFKVNTLKIENSNAKYGDFDFYVSDQIIKGNEHISNFETSRFDRQTLTGFQYRKILNNGYLNIAGNRSLIYAEWGTSADDVSLNRERFSFSTTMGLIQKKSHSGFEIKDFILSLSSNNVTDKTGNESELLKNEKWQDNGASFLFSAWDHLDNAIIYLYANLGSNFRIPGIYERYTHALRPSMLNGDSLLLENKRMQEFGLKINSLENQAKPNFCGSMSYFYYSYKNKIKTIQYSASPLQFPINDGDAFISGIELNAEVFTFKRNLGFRSIYSSYDYSDQFSFPMQPLSIIRNNILFESGFFRAKITFKKEGKRVLPTINSIGDIENNYLSEYRSIDIHASYVFNSKNYQASIAIFGQNLNNNAQVLEGISIFDKRVYISLGLEW